MHVRSIRRARGPVLVSTILLVLFVSSAPFAGAQSPVTITFLHGWDRERTDLMNEVLDRFEAKYPWITVESLVVAPGELGQRLTVMTAGAVPPDLAMISAGSSITFGVRGMLTPLGEFVARDRLALDELFYPPVANALVNNPITGIGNFYYLPQLVDTSWYLFYNKGHFAAAGLDVETPPKTWSELEEMARRLNRPDPEGGWSQLGIDVAQTTYDQLYGEWLTAAGGRIYSDDLRRVIVGDVGNQGLSTLEWIVRFTNEVNGGIAAQESVNRYARSGFYSGQMSMLLNGAWSYFQILENAPGTDVGVAPIPHRDGFDFRPPMSLGWGYGIPAGAAQKEAAWLLLKFLTVEVDGGGYFVLKQGRPGATAEINLQPEYHEAHPYWHVVQENFNRSVPAQFTPSISGTGSLGRQMVNSVVRGLLRSNQDRDVLRQVVAGCEHPTIHRDPRRLSALVQRGSHQDVARCHESDGVPRKPKLCVGPEKRPHTLSCTFRCDRKIPCTKGCADIFWDSPLIHTLGFHGTLLGTWHPAISSMVTSRHDLP